MNETLRTNKKTIRAWLQNPASGYTDEVLAMTLAHAQSGKLSFFSCCCFIGIPTADHALQGYQESLALGDAPMPHYNVAKKIAESDLAEYAYRYLSFPAISTRTKSDDSDIDRLIRFVPILKAEIRRRDRFKDRIRQSMEELSPGIFATECLTYNPKDDDKILPLSENMQAEFMSTDKGYSDFVERFSRGRQSQTLVEGGIEVGEVK